MRNLPHDLRITLRLLLRHPGFTALAVAVLGLGIGASTATYSVLRGVVLRPLPFPAPDRLVAVGEVEEGSERGVSVPTLLDWKGEQRGLSSLTAYLEGRGVLTGGDGSPREVSSALVTRDFFRTLGVGLSEGAGFGPGDHDPGAEPTVVVSYQLWRRELGADPRVVGRMLELDETAHRIVGVAPPDMDFPEDTEVWLPLMARAPEFRRIRGAHIFQGVGRLASGVTPQQSQEELSRLSTGISDYGDRWSARVRPLRRAIAGDAREPLLTLLGAVLFVLLVACANVANLSLARTYSREREMAVRAALGAGPGRIASLILSESVVVALVAGGMGILLTYWGLDLLLTLVPGRLPRADGIVVDGGVLVFAVGVAVLSGLVAGFAPTLRSLRPGLALALKDGGTGIAGRMSARRLRRGLVVVEVALTVVLLAGGALLLRSFTRIVRVDPGFRPANTLTFGVSLPEHRYPEEAQWRGFYDELVPRLEGLSGVSSAALARNLPVTGSDMTSPVEVEGRGSPESEGPTYVQVSTVSQGYFATMGIPLVEGRGFDDRDREGSTPVAVVNESFARAFLQGDRALGRRARTFFGEQRMREIVGVVADVHHSGLTDDAPPTFYVPARQDPQAGFRVVLRTEGDPAEVLPSAREVLGRLDPLLPMTDAATLEELLGRTVAEPRFYTLVLGSFALLALLVAAMGLYGVMATSVASRRREMGIRFAVGAGRDEVLGLVLREALLLAGVGVALGAAGALGLGRVLRGLLFQVGPADPLALIGGAALAMVACAVAAWVPARRAAKVNPVDVLRT